jgi:glc operon protein GlcG
MRAGCLFVVTPVGRAPSDRLGELEVETVTTSVHLRCRYIRDMATTLSSVSISLEGARRVLDAAIAKATEMGLDACISVCDPAGHAVLSARMDGAPLLSVDIAANKAYTVVAFKGMPTHLWWGGIKDDPSLVHGLTKSNRFIIFGGGIPVRVKKKLVGAVGVSGGSAEQDQAIAEAAAAAL